MCRKFVWCYIFLLTLLDISLKTTLIAQGNSHAGISLHDSLMEGMSFQEWSDSSESVRSDEEDSSGAGVTRVVRLEPAALAFGRCELGAAHARRVVLTNAGNTTLHLASVAGTTPDFHASFFEAKTLPAGGNTSFTVVYLGRGEGAVSARLFLHTSRGVRALRVSARGVPSAWRVWPLLAVRVPADAAVEPLLSVHNPTDHTVQVSEIYSSAPWLGLQLVEGGSAARGAAWSLAPHSSRALARLVLRPPAAAPRTAYVRVRLAATQLVLAVEARKVPPGEHATPLHIRLSTKGTEDPPCKFEVSVGNSGQASVSVEASVWGARCAADPPPPPAPPAPPDELLAEPPHAHAHTHNGDHTHNGGSATGSSGVELSLHRSQLAPRSPPLPAATLTIDYGALWSSFAAGAPGAGEAWCSGWARVGRAALPYSLRLLPGTLRLAPAHLDFVLGTASLRQPQRLVVHNTFAAPLLVTAVDYPPLLEQHFEVECQRGAVAAGAQLALCSVAPRASGERGEPPAMRTALTVRTNLTDYTVPLRVYTTQLHIEWQWPGAGVGRLALGAVGGGERVVVRARLHNPAPVRACGLALGVARLPAATFTLDPHLACAHNETCGCIPGGGWVWAELRVRAPARRTRLRGAAWARAGAAPPARHRVSLSVHPGRLAVHHRSPLDAAPYAGSWTPLVLESSMPLQLRVLNVTQPPGAARLDLLASTEECVVRGGGKGAGSGGDDGGVRCGSLRLEPERACAPHCYTGLPLHTSEGAAWLSRGAGAVAGGGAGAGAEAALRDDAVLLRARAALYLRAHAQALPYTVHIHTDKVLQVPVEGSTRALWPRLCGDEDGLGHGAGDAGVAGVGGAGVPMLVRVRNPSRTHPLLLQPLVHDDHIPLPDIASVTSPLCARALCVSRAGVFSMGGGGGGGAAGEWWVPTRGEAGPLPDHNHTLLLAPGAELQLRLHFAPQHDHAYSSHLYLRNNLTILESVQLTGRGVYPSFEFVGRKSDSDAPLLFEVNECPGGGSDVSGGGDGVRRKVVVRNTGAVPLRLREWRVCGAPCEARGFRLEPCPPPHPLPLLPNETRALHLTFSPDLTLARVPCLLTVRSDLGRATLPLLAAASARLLPACAARAPRPPFEPLLRGAGAVLALLAALLALAAAALDAERLLRRAKAARAHPPPPHPPLDLNRAPPPAVPLGLAPAAPLPPRRRKPVRRAPPPPPQLDPLSERRAFERWRAEVLRCSPPPQPPARTDDERSSSEVEAEAEAEQQEREARTSGDEDDGSTATDTSSSLSPPDQPDHSDRCEEPPLPACPRTPTPPPTADDEKPLRPAGSQPATDIIAPLTDELRRPSAEGPRRMLRARSQERPELTGPRPRPTAAKHTRKEKILKRRSERSGGTPARGSPAHGVETRGAGSVTARSTPDSPPPPLTGAPGATPPLRWGAASWSSVVAARGSPVSEQLAPIGSAMRRRVEPTVATAAADNSLFYFNGVESEFSWRAPPAPPSSHPDRPPYTPTHSEYNRATNGEQRTSTNGGFGSIRSLWTGPEERVVSVQTGGGGTWMWGGRTGGAAGTYGALRPPPGFSAPPVRPFDPFQSLRLSAIWAPGAFDWRRDEPAPPAQPAQPAPPADD